MGRMIGTLALAAALAGCGSAEETPTAAVGTPAQAEAAETPEPNLAACAKAEANPDRQRTKPLAVPEAFGKLAKSDLDHVAVVTADGGTVCVDTNWIESIDRAKASSDGRFFAFGWSGYEAGGYVVIDRSGPGQVIDTGVPPLSPASGKRFAAVELSESGFGSLNAFAVWDILPVGLKEIAHIDQGLSTDGEWRIDGWEGDHCVKLSFVPSDRFPENYADLPKVAGDPWFAAEKNRWKPAAGSCPRA
jgi:hypothetical protein